MKLTHTPLMIAISGVLLLGIGAFPSSSYAAAPASATATDVADPVHPNRAMTPNARAAVPVRNPGSDPTPQDAASAVAAGQTAASPRAPASARAQTLETVEVTGILGSLLRETTTKRTNPGIVDSISAEEVGTFPDTTIAGSLQRVPGVSVDRGADGEANQISVRGFGPDFVNVLLNGHRIATTTLGRSFNLDTLPVDLLQQAVVYKTFQPNLPVGGIGGTVNIVTWQPLEFHGFHASATVGARRSTLPGQSSGSKTKPQLSGMIGDTTQNGRFGWLLAGSFEQRDEQFTNMNFDGGWPDLNLPLVSSTKVYPIPTDNEASYDFQTRTRASADLSIEANPTDRLHISSNFLITRYTGRDDVDTNDIFAEVNDVTSIATDANGTPTSYTTNGAGGFQDVFKPQLDPTNIRQGSGYIRLDYVLGGGNTVSLESDASNALNKTIGYNGVAGYLFNTDAPVTFTNPGNEVFPSFSGGLGSADITNLRTHYPEPGGSSSSDHVYSHNLNFRHDFESGIITDVVAGLSNTTETQTGVDFALPDNGNVLVPYYDPFNVVVPPAAVDAHLVTYRNLGGKYGALWPSTFVTYNPQLMMTFLQTPAAYGQLSPELQQQFRALLASYGGQLPIVPVPSTYERVHEIDNSAYGMVDLGSSIAGHRWSAQVGFRYTRTNVTSAGIGQPLLALEFDPGDLEFAQPVYGTTTELERHGKYRYFLPSVNIKFDLLDDVILRAAFSKTLTRPDPADLATSQSFGTEARISESTGNAALEPYLSRNYDVGASWYFGGPSYVSLDVFEKKVSNFVTTVTSVVPVSSVVPSISPLISGSLIDPGLLLTEPVNLNKASVYGFEATFNYSFDKLLPGWLGGFGVATNYTNAHSTAQSTPGEVAAGNTFAIPGMGGSYNASVYYQDFGLSTRLAYNVRDKYLVSAAGVGGVPVDAARYGELDFSATYDVNKHTSVFFDADNINNASVFEYSMYVNRPILGSVFGRRFTMGVKWKL